jgi:hypothetical protein
MSSINPMRDGMHLKNQMWETGTAEFDVAHAFAAYAREGDFDTAPVADDSAMLDSLVLPARSIPNP